MLVAPGWLQVYGKESQDDDANLVPVAAGEKPLTEKVEAVGLVTKPPARYTEATLLSAMEGAGKLVDDDDLREAMAGKGLGTPATRAAIIEGLLYEKYMVREGRELIPTAKAFQLMTLLRGLDVSELTAPELTGEWEHKLALMEKGAMSREAFMREIAQMTQIIVKRAKEYDSDTIPGDYATLETPCPNCGGQHPRELPPLRVRRRAHGERRADGALRLLDQQDPRRAAVRDPRGRGAADEARDRAAAGFPQQDGPAVRGDPEDRPRRRERQPKLEFDFGQSNDDEDAEPVDFTGQTALGSCPKCGGAVYEHGSVVRLRERGQPAEDLRLQDRQDHPAAGGRPGPDPQAARDRPHRPAARLQVVAHESLLQGVPRVGRRQGQGRRSSSSRASRR